MKKTKLIEILNSNLTAVLLCTLIILVFYNAVLHQKNKVDNITDLYEQQLSNDIKIEGEVYINGKTMYPADFMMQYLENEKSPIFVREATSGQLFISSDEMILKDKYMLEFRDRSQFLITDETLKVEAILLESKVTYVVFILMFILALILLISMMISEIASRRKKKNKDNNVGLN